MVPEDIKLMDLKQREQKEKIKKFVKSVDSNFILVGDRGGNNAVGGEDIGEEEDEDEECSQQGNRVPLILDSDGVEDGAPHHSRDIQEGEAWRVEDGHRVSGGAGAEVSHRAGIRLEGLGEGEPSGAQVTGAGKELAQVLLVV